MWRYGWWRVRGNRKRFKISLYLKEMVEGDTRQENAGEKKEKGVRRVKCKSKSGKCKEERY
ncbi:hypothetical protein PP707_06410 [Acetobacter pasteurianus]|nr:hypothetical protein [Acetobacter pasteurianus]